MELKKRLNFGSLMRHRSSQDVHVDPNADTPESNAARGVRLFCESAAANSGEEVLHLPTIVESAVASPTAAAAAAQQIRKFLSKENYGQPHVQYNAVMLIRILADNPGQSFTKNMDKQFADTVKHLLRNGQDPSVSQILRESLDSMEREKAYDTNLNTIFAMWRKEKGLMANAAKQLGPRKLNAPAWNGQSVQGGFSEDGHRHRSRSKGLPPPIELAGRIEEARTSAKLLLQLVQSTPAHELIGNELVKEFAERCTAAQRSVQGYIACDNPAPDDDTMLTLIETNEQLSLAASKHQRAVLQARRLQSPSPVTTPPISQVNSNNLPPHNGAPSLPPVNAPTDMSYGQPPASTYSPPPGAPHGYAPSPAQSSNPASYKNDELSLPPTLQAGGSRPGPTSTSAPADDNPFGDHHTSTFTPPTNPRAEGYGGSPDSYHPGFQSTPSYLGRQDSSANNLTMHGAAPQIKEEDESPYDMRQPKTPELNVPQQQTQHDVSPIAERNTVTYRY
ncbi:hypothetical protein HBI80_201750 [Parastagonospora nodorum]|nr:hypothetical protein HBH46_222990 [Parastagonospora nodorum]KAH4896776.1 hypothetical protein HBI80_201750 [Parastagonospora nodorum]KAH5173449.1 hypothetical protein HBH76_237720 [Parastagonospora nodorum]KAH5727431.1 hypothetical protein HBI20_068500 [Parastagonospora nodorum]KAH6121678.1 hypothetical protein HBI69_064270 [Parastagonospora nodorum]